jgi:hypothetical protein
MMGGNVMAMGGTTLEVEAGGTLTSSTVDPM